MTRSCRPLMKPSATASAASEPVESACGIKADLMRARHARSEVWLWTNVITQYRLFPHVTQSHANMLSAPRVSLKMSYVTRATAKDVTRTLAVGS